MIESLSHITFIVKNLNRTTDLLKSVFDEVEVLTPGIRGAKG
jgi:hypothetical protein